MFVIHDTVPCERVLKRWRLLKQFCPQNSDIARIHFNGKLTSSPSTVPWIHVHMYTICAVKLSIGEWGREGGTWVDAACLNILIIGVCTCAGHCCHSSHSWGLLPTDWCGPTRFLWCSTLKNWLQLNSYYWWWFETCYLESDWCTSDSNWLADKCTWLCNWLLLAQLLWCHWLFSLFLDWNIWLAQVDITHHYAS